MIPRDISKNYIANFPNDSTAAGFDNLTELCVTVISRLPREIAMLIVCIVFRYLNDNNLTSFSTVLPAIQTL